MKRIIQNLPILQYLSKLTKSEQKQLISGAPRSLLICFSEIALNLVEKNIPLTKKQIGMLRKHESKIKDLTSKKHSLNKRKIILRGGSFLKDLLQATLPPMIVSVIRKSPHHGRANKLRKST